MRLAKMCVGTLERSIPILLLMALTACTGAPPDFSIERERMTPIAQEGLRSFSVGSLATPPPGDYRFLRMDGNGGVEVRELQTFNGPGPWLAYVGRTLASPSVAREALATIDATSPTSAPGDDRAPCVLTFDSLTGGMWQGCAYPALAERVLSQVPRLTAPDVTPECHLPVCQVRILREAVAVGHEPTGGVSQDIVLDQNGRFWCARDDNQQLDQANTNTLRVERGSISQREAPEVFEWLLAGVERAVAANESLSTPEAVLVRGRGSDWTRVRRFEAEAIQARWQLLAIRLPDECRPGH